MEAKYIFHQDAHTVSEEKCQTEETSISMIAEAEISRTIQSSILFY